MRKFCSLFLAIILIILSTSFAAHASTDTSQVPVEYSVTVPANLAPGEEGLIKVEGTWNSNQMLKISCPSEITLKYNNQSVEVEVYFAGISQQGLNEEYVSLQEEISIQNIEVSFGTWTGVIPYNVELITDEGALVDETIPTEPEIPTEPSTPPSEPAEDDSNNAPTEEPTEEQSPTLPPIETEPEEESEEDIPPLPEY